MGLVRERIDLLLLLLLRFFAGCSLAPSAPQLWTRKLWTRNLCRSGSLSPARALAGSKVTYLIGVGNLGSVTASDVIVTDVLPANTTFVSVSARKVNCSVSGGKLTCSTATVPCITGSTVSCNIGTLMPLSWSTLNGATIKLTVQLGSALTAGTTFSNTATVAGSNADPLPGNNSSTATTLVTSY